MWLKRVEIFPAFLSKSFIDHDIPEAFSNKILKKMRENSVPYQFKVDENNLISDLLKGFRSTPKSSFAGKLITINFKAKAYSPVSILPFLNEFLLNNETLVKIKESGFIVLNKFKTS